MKIGILTFFGAPNYGALLQAYALRQATQALGGSVEFIDYRPPYVGWQWWKNLGLRSGSFMRAVPRKLKFADFRRRHLPSTPVLRNARDLRRMAGRYDAVIAGSDQVWSGNVHGRFDPAYFLDFVQDSACRRISYAACFGQAEQPHETLEKAGPLLRRFDRLSVRNEMSRQLVRQIADCDATIVEDPTALHDFSEIKAQQYVKKDYILVYSLCPEQARVGECVLRNVKERMSLQAFSVWPTEKFAGVDRIIRTPGPSEWVGWFKGAAAVCTDSFHGLAFALKFRKPVFAWAGGSPGRLQDYLLRHGVAGRLVTSCNCAKVEPLIETSEEWRVVDKRERALARQSMEFLADALKW